MLPPPPSSTLFPYTTLFRSIQIIDRCIISFTFHREVIVTDVCNQLHAAHFKPFRIIRSEEHTSELQSRGHLVCRLLLEKKKQKQNQYYSHIYRLRQEQRYET